MTTSARERASQTACDFLDWLDNKRHPPEDIGVERALQALDTKLCFERRPAPIPKYVPPAPGKRENFLSLDKAKIAAWCTSFQILEFLYQNREQEFSSAEVAQALNKNVKTTKSALARCQLYGLISYRRVVTYGTKKGSGHVEWLWQITELGLQTMPRIRWDSEGKPRLS